MADDESPLRGTGPRLISVAEAAEILRVTEKTVLEWIANDQIPYVTLPNGEFCIQLVDESHDGLGPVQSGFLMLAVGGGPDQASRQAFEAELSARRRQAALAGLDFGGLDVDDVAAVLADRLGAVVPDGIYVTQESGMVWIKEAQGHRSGSDVALMLSGDADSTEERVRRAAQDVLDTAQEMISQETTDPWPARAGEVPGGFPRSRAEISSGTVRLFYGRPDAECPDRRQKCVVVDLYWEGVGTPEVCGCARWEVAGSDGLAVVGSGFGTSTGWGRCGAIV